MNTMRYLCSLFGASTDDLVTAETPAGLRSNYWASGAGFSLLLFKVSCIDINHISPGQVTLK